MEVSKFTAASLNLNQLNINTVSQNVQYVREELEVVS